MPITTGGRQLHQDDISTLEFEVPQLSLIPEYDCDPGGKALGRAAPLRLNPKDPRHGILVNGSLEDKARRRG